MSGMPVLATKTFENQKYVTESCGVLIEDNPRSFAFGLKKLFDKRHTYSSLNISNLYSNFTWERIVNKKLSPLLQMIHND
jgi:hypothetical protein